MIYGEKKLSHLLNISKLFVFNLTRILDLLRFLQEFYIDPMMIHRIIRLSMQGPDPQYFYPGKVGDHALAIWRKGNRATR
jgi:hypothetical protein